MYRNDKMTQCRECKCVLLFLAIGMTIPGLLMIIFGCSDTFFCPLYSSKDAIVEGLHIDTNTCYVRQIRITVPCYSLFVSYSFDDGKCDNYAQLFTYQSSSDNYGYAVNQTRKVWVSKTDNTCGLSNIARDIGMGGFMFLMIGIGFFIYAFVIFLCEYHKKHKREVLPTERKV